MQAGDRARAEESRRGVGVCGGARGWERDAGGGVGGCRGEIMQGEGGAGGGGGEIGRAHV